MVFNESTTTTEVLKGKDLTGKVAMITGATSGLGEETARAMAENGATLILAARNIGQNNEIAEKLRASYSVAIDCVQIDLADLDSVKKCAETVLASHGKIDILINNAGIMACPFSLASSGYELQFATNHLGHFFLTGLLLPALKAAGRARIVCLSSGAHKYSPVNFDDINFENRDYEKWTAYGQSKTANSLFAVGLTERFAKAGVVANAVHPGIIATNLSRHLEQVDLDMMAEMYTSGEMKLKEIPQGAATSVWAATAEELEGRGGLYLNNCQIAEPIESGIGDTGYFPYALDSEAATQLWDLSEKIVGQQFS